MEIHEGRTRWCFESRVVGEHSKWGEEPRKASGGDAAFEMELEDGRGLVG